MVRLEKICLNSIVDNFERYYLAFTLSKDDNLGLSFEFLQRRYSTELATELYQQSLRTYDDLKEEYLEFLINEHLYLLQEEWLGNSLCSNSMGDIFHRLPNLTTIDFAAMNCGDELLKNIAKFCSKIVEIRLRYSNVTDNGVKYLCERKNGTVPYPELKNLFIETTVGWSLFTDTGAEYLIRNLPSLEKFNYRNAPLLLHQIHEDNFNKFKSMHFYNLVELNFFELHNFLNLIHLPIYTDALKTCLTVCHKLQSLACYISDKEQLNFFTKSSLKKLHLAFRNPKTNIEHFLKKNGFKLTSLKITGCTLSICVLGVSCPSLKEFFAECINFTDDYDYDLQPNFVSLIKCYFKDIEASSNEGVCSLLSSSLRLEFISFDKCMLSLELKAHILLWCKNPFAKNIEFGRIIIYFEMDFLKDILLNCPSLKTMRVIDYLFYGIGSEEIDLKRTLLSFAASLPNKPKIVLF